MTTVTAYRRGRVVFALLWLIGLALLSSMAAGLVPGGGGAMALVVLGLLLTLIVGVVSQRCGFLARPIVGLERAGDRIALTFDDGPDPEFTPRILDLLAGANQQATFFVIGDRAARHPELTRRIVEQGHSLGNHTMHHPWHMALWPVSRIVDELNQASDLLQRIAGVRPHLFRPPAAMLSPRIAAAAVAAELHLVGFSTRSGDGSPLIGAERALRRLRRGLRPGAILLLHDTAVNRTPVSLEVLPRLLEAMQQADLRSVGLAEMILVDSGVR